MKAYQYNEENKKFEMEVNCQIDPLETKKAGYDIWLLPANSTFKKPLPEKEGFDVCYNKKGDVWEYVEKQKPQEPTEEEQKENIRSVCSSYINEISWRVERYNTQKELGIETSDTAETYLKILEYMQYLREYDEQTGEWWLEEPKTFEDWKESNSSDSVLSESESEVI